jgi:hypothetical protein
MAQALVPHDLSIAAAIAFGIAETFAGVLLVVPRFRRWGAWLSVALLLAFLGYFAIHYGALRGEECSCFPWIKRAVGPGFFIGDGVMLALAALAGVWARPSESRRGAAIILGAVAVFALVSYGVTAARQTGVRAPATITVNGQPFNLREGKVFVYFFDPQCMHCDEAAQRMAKHSWGDTTVIAVPTDSPHFANDFLRDTGMKAQLSSDLVKLRQTFKFTDAPYAVAIEHGYQKAALGRFDEIEPEKALRELGFIR